MHVVDEGAGPPMLMLHGNPTSSFLYRHLIAGLRDRHRCVAPDLPGFGRSPAPAGYGYTPAEHADAIERLVLERDLTDITLFGQDWGGPIGLAVAGRHPERFSRLVLANTFAWPANGDLHFELFSRIVGGPLGRLAIRHRNAFVEWVMPAAFGRTKLSAEAHAAYRAPFPTAASREPTAVFPREILGSRAFLAEVEARLPRHLPTLLVWGDADVAFRRQERERFAALLDDTTTVVLEGVGHYVQEEAPDAVLAAIAAWDRVPA